MRKARVLGEPCGVYHITSRILEKRFLLDETEKERFRTMMWQVADFCGINVLTHCMMGNHVHLLVEVPARPATVPPEQIAWHLDFLPKAPSAPRSPGGQFRADLARMKKWGLSPEIIEAFLETFRARMYDLSRFGQELKQRFTQDYNRRHQRKGPLWEERFKSVLLQEDPRVLLKVAAYIDLNPLRAGLCEDPMDYRYCGYAGAVAGDPRCLAGLKRLCELMNPTGMWDPGHALEAYRLALFGDARPREARPGKSARAGVSEATLASIRKVGGKLGLRETLSVRLRYLSEGMVLGSRIFVENHACRVQEKNRLKKIPLARPTLEGEAMMSLAPRPA